MNICGIELEEWAVDDSSWTQNRYRRVKGNAITAQRIRITLVPPSGGCEWRFWLWEELKPLMSGCGSKNSGWVGLDGSENWTPEQAMEEADRLLIRAEKLVSFA